MSHPLYDKIADSYLEHRRPDPRIAARINSALEHYHSILNVGAGTGSYEPVDKRVIATDPSIEMTRRRRRQQSQAIQGSVDQLPFIDCAFDASLAILTIHHWPDPERGLAEMRRVSRKGIVILTWDPEHAGFWLVRDYVPEVLAIDRPIFPSLANLTKALGSVEVQTVPIAADCTDGFLGAYWSRPAAYLDPGVRAAISTFSKFDPTAGLSGLRRDLEDGTWHDKNEEIQALPELDIGYRLVIAKFA